MPFWLEIVVAISIILVFIVIPVTLETLAEKELRNKHEQNERNEKEK